MKIFIIIFYIFISINSCKQTGESVFFNVPPGSYAYFGYDSSSTLIAKGWFKFEYEDSVKIKGNWQIESISDADNTGFQDGVGELVGSYTDSSVYINLHPDFVDNNVILIGKFKNKYLYGKWQWVTYAGITNSGSFNSKRN